MLHLALATDLPKIPFDWIIGKVSVVLLFLARIFAVLFLLFIIFAPIGLFFLAGENFKYSRTKPEKSLWAKVDSSLYVIGPIFCGLFLWAMVVFGIIDAIHQPTVAHPQGITGFQRITGSIAMILTAALLLFIVKPIFLRLYSILEFILGIALAAYAAKNWTTYIDIYQVVPAISSVYFLIRAMESFKKDWVARADGTHEKMWDDIQSRWCHVQWAVERFFKKHVFKRMNTTT